MKIPENSMKRTIWAFIVLFVIALANQNIVANDMTVPQEVYQVAEDSLALRKSVWVNNPTQWGLQNAKEVEELILGGGLRINYLGSESRYIRNSQFLDDLVADSIETNWLFFIEHKGTIIATIEVGRSSGSDYSVVGVSSNDHYCQSLDMTRKKFLQLLEEMGNASEISLYRAGYQYIFAATVGKTEWALPTPYDDSYIDRPETWPVERLWTSAEIIQVFKNFAEEMGSQPGSERQVGLHIVFSKIPKVDADYSGLIGILITVGIILIAIFVFWVRKVIRRRAAHHATD